ncbi:hypothetical protein [uncultured Acinetobacter sp.]|uniref:hypothetical protein n=1 Tax=uncultured Acinetobacter sp. TaxID=165433 RepID=UPI0025CBA974|nr:hypothetical protein [uncultured Acinetobacter sp.]
MYFWNTKKLVADIKNNVLTENDYKNYYIAGGVLLLFVIFFAEIIPHSNILLGSIVKMVSSIFILIVGVNAAFKVCQSKKDFIKQYLAVIFPIILKYWIMFLILSFIIVFIFTFYVYGERIELDQMSLVWLDVGMGMLYQIIAYWRAYVAIKQI